MKVETKTEEINWDKPQLVVSGESVVRTNGKHSGEHFEGIDVLFASEESYSQRWRKPAFKPFHGTISNDGIYRDLPKFQPVTITIESEEELLNIWHILRGANEAGEQLDEIVKQRNLYK
jgi:hypothetical protein